MKKKKGFTLVELIVVLVILGILIALLVPALTGYIRKANEKKVVAEARMVLMAAQTLASEYYAENDQKAPAGGVGDALAFDKEDFKDLAEVSVDEDHLTELEFNDDASVKKLVYTSGGYTAKYEDGSFSTKNSSSSTSST